MAQPAYSQGDFNYSPTSGSNYTSIGGQGINYAPLAVDSSLGADWYKPGGVTPPTGGLPSWLNKGNTDMLGSLASGAGSIWNAYNGMQQAKLAKEQFKFSKGAFNANFANQAKTLNTGMEDRQQARIGGTGDNNAAGNYDSVATYMDKNRINGAPIN